MELERWKKASASNANGGCVEFNGDRNKVRDSKNPSGPVISADVVSFIAEVKTGRFDLDRNAKG
jgi:hypothetical protein